MLQEMDPHKEATTTTFGKIGEEEGAEIVEVEGAATIPEGHNAAVTDLISLAIRTRILAMTEAYVCKVRP